MEEKVRVSKLLSELGLCSRREADSYIEQGLVTVDGELVNELGVRAFRHQKIELQSVAKAQQASRITVILNKPVGVISHFDDEQEYKPAASLITPENYFPSPLDRGRSPRFNTKGLAPAGRLDIDSTGMLVLTQDGRIAKLLIGENSPIEKEYLVRRMCEMVGLKVLGLKRVRMGRISLGPLPSGQWRFVRADEQF